MSLLRDSYVDIADRELDELIAYFLALKRSAGPRRRREFRRRFDLMALQRNLKALGTFGYQTTTRRNPVYIQYMPRTLEYARPTSKNTPGSPVCGSCSPRISTSCDNECAHLVIWLKWLSGHWNSNDQIA